MTSSLEITDALAASLVASLVPPRINKRFFKRVSTIEQWEDGERGREGAGERARIKENEGDRES